ncbi:response regulator [Paraburkholderia sp. J11-2]|uniref:response regulator n=1 Tax=Paraburkholderia sp. J11-2 TaxID=2805431 RepID=UPI002AB6720A|nr:response regulator [Paraburkholderia sp. J11-2]
MSNHVKIRVILADDHPLVIAGATRYLSRIETINIVGTAHDSGDVVEKLDQTTCDVLITGYSMPNGKFGDGLAYLSFLRRRYPHQKIIVYTSVDDPALVSEINRLGIRAVVNKMSEMETLLAAINAAFAGDTFSPEPEVGGQRETVTVDEQRKHPLSAREAEVMRLFISGLRISEIAQKLRKTHKTISTQKCAAMRKLGARGDADLFRIFSIGGRNLVGGFKPMPMVN